MSSVPSSLGIRVRSGTACAIVLIGPGESPRFAFRKTLDLCDPDTPRSRQPYHAVMLARASEARRIEAELRAVVQKATARAVRELIDDAGRDGLTIARGALVVGSQIDPGRIANEHIRAHAQEGRLFRTAVLDSLQGHGLTCTVFVEREIYSQAADVLGKPADEIKRMLSTLGRGNPGPWRAEEKLATLAAWMALCGR